MSPESVRSPITLPQTQPSPAFWTRKRFLQAMWWWASALALWIGKYNAEHPLFSEEKIPLMLPEELRWMTILFPTDIHINGNIDSMAKTVGMKMNLLLSGSDPEKTLILHGGDFVCKRPDETPLKSIYEISPLLLEPLSDYKHQYWVPGNHDVDHSEHAKIIDYFGNKHQIDFLTSPYQRRNMRIGDAEIEVFGLHTAATILHTMDPIMRDNLLDAYIQNLNSGKQACNILLMHNPDGLEFLLRRLRKTETQLTIPTLMFAGHTHGGMINVPWLRDIALRRANVHFGRYNGWYTPWFHDNTGKWALNVSTGMGNSRYIGYRWWADPEVKKFVV